MGPTTYLRLFPGNGLSLYNQLMTKCSVSSGSVVAVQKNCTSWYSSTVALSGPLVILVGAIFLKILPLYIHLPININYFQ